MKGILIRILMIPLYMVHILLCLTIIIPILYWIFTGDDFINVSKNIYNEIK